MANGSIGLAGRRVLVMGLGRFGGGVGVARFLIARGAEVTVTDREPAESLRASMAQLEGLPIRWRLGGHREEDFTAADLIVVNPAVPAHRDPYLRAAAAAGVPTTSEIRLLLHHLPDRRQVIGVTGAAGKSTVTAMVGHLLARCLEPEHVHVGGNLGGSLLPVLEKIRLHDWVVLELSSFMLEGMRADRWSPPVAVVTSFAPNHLDWHETLEAYQAAKQVILDFQQPWATAVLGPGASERFVTRGERAVVAESDWPADAPELAVPGRHNRVNALLAAHAVGVALGVPAAELLPLLADFPGLPHRLQLIAERQEVRYFNDSKSTTPEAAVLAIESFPVGTVHAILGGYDKGSDMSALAACAAARCRAVYTIGATGPALAALIEARAKELEAAALHGPSLAAQGCGGSAGWTAGPAARVLPCGDLDTALRRTATEIRRGDVVLLSPGCASWDQFENYEARARAFVEAVLKYTGEDAPPVR